MDIYERSAQLIYSAERLSLHKGEEMPLNFNYPSVIFIYEGELQLSFFETEMEVVNNGEMFFAPPSTSIYLKCKVDFSGIRLNIPDITRMCHHFFQSSIVADKKNFSQLIHALPMEPHITRWLISMREYIEDKKIDSGLTEIKTFELFHLLRNSYQSETLSSFFAPVLHEDYKFALFILSNYSSVKTAEELARLSNFSFSGFEKQFRKVFGSAPYRWMLKKKSEKVYREIYETSKPLKAIADECGFSGLSQFSDFCRKHFKLTPGAIRNKRTNSKEL